MMVQYELTDDTAWPKSWAGGKINQPGQLAPHPSDKDNQTEHWVQTFQFDRNNVYISYN